MSEDFFQSVQPAGCCAISIPIHVIANGISLNKPANIQVIIPGGDVVAVAIGIALLAGELTGVIARIYIEHLPNKKGKQRAQFGRIITYLLGWLYADTVKFQSMSILRYFRYTSHILKSNIDQPYHIIRLGTMIGEL